jgi:nicotinamidase-related amidase
MSDDAKKDAELQPHEELLATIGEFVLAGRHDRVELAHLGTQPPEVGGAVGYVRDTLAALAGTLQPEAPPPALRGRLMATLAAKAKVKRSALLVIDMIKDHLEPGRMLEVPRAREVVPALAKRLEEARASGMPIIYVVDEHDADDPDLDEWGGHAVKGTDGSDVWPALAPKPGDRVVNKGAYSAFHETKLAGVLTELGVDSLVLTGCMTEIGIMSTATDAMQRGFEVTVPADSQAGATPVSEQCTLGALGLMAPYGPARKKLLAQLAHAAP